jgi:uncharacterized membrane protein (UPF0182 family)
MLRSFAGFALIVSALLAAALYYVRGGIVLDDRGAAIDEKVRRHLAVLVVLLGGIIAAGFYLDSFKLMFANNGIFTGAGYVDVNSRLLTYRILTFLTPFAGIMLAAGLWKGAWRAALLPPVILLAVYFVGIRIYPGLPRGKVAPNELALRPRTSEQYQFTRFGYDLEKIEVYRLMSIKLLLST